MTPENRSSFELASAYFRGQTGAHMWILRSYG